MKRLEIPFYNFPSTSHLKIIFYAFKKTAKYFGNKSEFFCFGGKVTNVWVTIQYNKFNKMQSKAMQCNTIQCYNFYLTRSNLLSYIATLQT